MCCLKFLTPQEGVCLTNKGGILREDGKALLVTVQIQAAAGLTVTVNGIAAAPTANAYCATVPLTAYKNTLTATDGQGNSTTITVFWLPRATNCYRLSLDDNIRFLEDIAKNAHRYGSIFENPYLSFLREVHERYGTKVHANLFYEAGGTDGFTLSQMPDTFRHEFEANSDWLRFSFHAKAEFPDRPYLHTDYQHLFDDLHAVKEQILRFASERAYAASSTTLHWGETSEAGIQALHDAGVRTLAAFLLWHEAQGQGVVSYDLTKAQIGRALPYGIFKNKATDITYSKVDVILNRGKAEDIRATLDAAWEAYPQKGFWEFLMHEQYFYPDYKNYLPDFRARVLSALDWAEEQGLQPAFLSDTHLPW